MPSNPDRFTPVSCANTDRIHTNVELPFGLSDEVGINTKFATALLQIGGFRHVRITGDSEGETSQVIPQIMGTDAHGLALAGEALVKTVPTHSYEVAELKDETVKQARWKDLDLTLNLAEIINRIEQTDKSVRDAQVWAQEVDQALRHTLINAGVENLLGGLHILEKLLVLIVYGTRVGLVSGVNINSISTNSIQPLSLEVALGHFIAPGIVWSFYESMKYGVEKPGEGRRFSTVLGPELDRALVLGVIGRLNKLAGVVSWKKPVAAVESK